MTSGSDHRSELSAPFKHLLHVAAPAQVTQERESPYYHPDNFSEIISLILQSKSADVVGKFQDNDRSACHLPRLDDRPIAFIIRELMDTEGCAERKIFQAEAYGC